MKWDSCEICGKEVRDGVVIVPHMPSRTREFMAAHGIVCVASGMYDPGRVLVYRVSVCGLGGECDRVARLSGAPGKHYRTGIPELDRQPWRWVAPPAPTDADLAAEHIAHGNQHATDRWTPWTGGPGAARAMLSLMSRISRQQRDREEISLGYRDTGGEGGVG